MIYWIQLHIRRGGGGVGVLKNGCTAVLIHPWGEGGGGGCPKWVMRQGHTCDLVPCCIPTGH